MTPPPLSKGPLHQPYVCSLCGRSSWHPRDLQERYCGWCGSEDGLLPKGEHRLTPDHQVSHVIAASYYLRWLALGAVIGLLIAVAITRWLWR